MIESLRKWFAQANIFLSRQIWEQELSGRPWIEAFALRQLRVGIIVVKGVLRGGLSWRASAMTLTTLLAIGPALILAFAVFRTIGGLPDLEAQLERLIYENIMPAQQAGMHTFLAEEWIANPDPTVQPDRSGQLSDLIAWIENGESQIAGRK